MKEEQANEIWCLSDNEKQNHCLISWPPSIYKKIYSGLGGKNSLKIPTQLFSQVVKRVFFLYTKNQENNLSFKKEKALESLRPFLIPSHHLNSFYDIAMWWKSTYQYQASSGKSIQQIHLDASEMDLSEVAHIFQKALSVLAKSPLSSTRLHFYQGPCPSLEQGHELCRTRVTQHNLGCALKPSQSTIKTHKNRI